MYIHEGNSWIKHFDFLIADLLCIQASFVVAYLLRHGTDANPYKNSDYLIASLVLCMMDLIVTVGTKSHSGILERGYWKEFISLVKQTVLISTLTITVFFIGKKSDVFSRSVFIVQPLLFLIFDYIARILWKKHLIRKDDKKRKKSLLIVADNDKKEEAVKSVGDKKVSKYKITAVVSIEDIESGKALAGDFIREWIDEALIVSNKSSPERTEYERQLQVMGITVHDVLTRKPIENRTSFYEEVAGYPTLTISVNEASELDAILKRTVDLLGGIVGSICCLLILLIVGPIIYIKDPGPIIFKQVRIGKNGKKFNFLKIRSMVTNAEERKKELAELNKVSDGMMFKIENDPRIIPGIGSFIRKTSLDEFPQFFNVLKGDMSLVGTRPPTVDEWEKYGKHHRLRLAIKPGITGMWQVSGRSKITDFEEVLKLDADYIYNWNLGLDIKILLLTVQSVLKRQGAE